ncbi:MAG: TonB-dependent receptor, partial [Bacteroidetes bacterium]
MFYLLQPATIYYMIYLSKLTKTKSLFFLCIAVCLICFVQPAHAQGTVEGTVVDAATSTPLVGARVLVKGKRIGAMTDPQGNFRFNSPAPPPIELEITYFGYDTLVYTVTSFDKKQKIELNETTLVLEEVEITASAQAEAQKRSPLTVESMSINAIKETPAANFYEGLGHLKGVDLNSASFGFKVVNTRGFNSTQPVRSLQLIDGVDNQSPGLNFSLGNFLGASELDLESVTLVVGASSAFYGPNAFNGVISMKTKNPFIHRGLSASIKVGERNWVEGAIRYAKVFTNKKGEERFAFKLNAFFLRADDWEADNFDEAYRDTTQLGAIPFVGIDNPGGYDAVNRYGDEISFNAAATGNDRINLPGLKRFYRTGYKEADLLDYNTSNVKLSASLHYKLRPTVELTVASNYSQGTTVFQGINRVSLKDIQFFQHKLEVKQEGKWFVRAYATHEDAGKSYDPVFTAFRLQNLTVNNLVWRSRYRDYYRNNITPRVQALEGYPPPPGPPSFIFDFAQQEAVLAQNRGLLQQWHQEARQAADIDFLQPGTAAFQAAFDSITSRITSTEGGTRFFDKSALYHLHAEYIFKPKFAEITVGGNGRLYTPHTSGSIFSDTNGVKITNFEYGLYAGLKKGLAEDRITLTATLRMDKNQNFDYLLSPALTGVFTINERNTLRASLSSAIRNPTLADQYLYYDIGGALLLGNITGYKDLVTLESLGVYFSSLNQADLVYFDVDRIQPEKVITGEIGYRGMLGQRVYIDAGYYYSRYTDFIGLRFGYSGTFNFGIPVGRVFRVASNA